MAQQALGAPSVKPTRLLGNLSCALHWLHLGPPRFDPQGRYLGPLPPRTSSAPPLIGKDNEGFATSAAAEWPPQMCAGVAESIMKDIDVDRLRENGEPLRVLYLFSGRRRQGSVRTELERLTAAARVQL